MPGVDYEMILKEAEKEADVIVWVIILSII
jgi:predicted GTPase